MRLCSRAEGRSETGLQTSVACRPTLNDVVGNLIVLIGEIEIADSGVVAAEYLE
jgi:hypothetical protein